MNTARLPPLETNWNKADCSAAESAVIVCDASNPPPMTIVLDRREISTGKSARRGEGDLGMQELDQGLLVGLAGIVEAVEPAPGNIKAADDEGAAGRIACCEERNRAEGQNGQSQGAHATCASNQEVQIVVRVISVLLDGAR